jgi:hypothetical protein
MEQSSEIACHELLVLCINKFSECNFEMSILSDCTETIGVYSGYVGALTPHQRRAVSGRNKPPGSRAYRSFQLRASNDNRLLFWRALAYAAVYPRY